MDAGSFHSENSRHSQILSAQAAGFISIEYHTIKLAMDAIPAAGTILCAKIDKAAGLLVPAACIN